VDETLDLCGMGPLCAEHYDTLVAELTRRHPDTDPHLIADAAEDALMDHFRRPERHDPARLPLGRYLLMAAAGDLSNGKRREGRHSRGRADVELDEVGGKGEGAALAALERQEETTLLLERVERVRPGLKPGDRAVLDLILRGEKRTEVFAEALSVSHLPRPGREREVKRAKDRVMKRLLREGHDSEAA